ncbi:MAG: hypothetical protein HFI03_12475 [Lachnospiraceae bacterium]|nr:hypothetical protein [Lachnospiraceae bacterium]
MRNKIVKRIAALLSVAVMCVSVVACGGGSEKAGADTLTEEEYEAKAEELGNSLNTAMTDAASIDPNDVEAAKEFIEGLKDPFIEFGALNAPAKYADAHAKFKSGCDAMVEYLDICVQAMDTGEVDMEKMTSLLTTIETDFTEGANMIE